MDREEKIVIKDQTFTDIAVNELADVKARLMIYKYYHQDKAASKLPIFQKFSVCYEQMNEYDKMRVDKYATDLFARYIANPFGFLPYKTLKRRAFILWLIFFCIFFFGFGALLGDYMLIYFEPKPKNVYYSKATIDLMVHENIMELQYKLYDIDRDGEIDCLDIGVEFKHLWDRKHPDIPCTPIQNINWAKNFNHLFIEIDGIYYEPSSFHIRDHTMYATWGNRFDPKYNHPYGGQQWYDKVSKYRRW